MKLGLYHQRTVGPVLHARLIVNDLTTTLIFPRMHGGTGTAYEQFRIIAMLRKHTDSQGHRHTDIPLRKM